MEEPTVAFSSGKALADYSKALRQQCISIQYNGASILPKTMPWCRKCSSTVAGRFNELDHRVDLGNMVGEYFDFDTPLMVFWPRSQIGLPVVGSAKPCAVKCAEYICSYLSRLGK